MPLFPSKANGQVTWDDVRLFLDRRVPENELLDYKEQMPQKPLEITIAAMANTYGGDILIGVGKDKKHPNLPQPTGEVHGLTNAVTVQTQIEDLNLNIQPPVLGVSAQVVDIPADAHPDGCDDHSVVVVRIGQSDLTPHFVPGWGHYGRAGARNQPYKDVPLETGKIEWLLDRRRRHVEFREELLRFADQVSPKPIWHKAWCVPLFPSPSSSLWAGVDYEHVRELCLQVRETQEDEALSFWQRGVNNRPRPIQHGWVWSDERQDVCVRFGYPAGAVLLPFSFYLVEDRGLVFYKGISKSELLCVGEEREMVPRGGLMLKGVRFEQRAVTLALVGVCNHAAALYREYGYNGPVQYGVEVGVDPSNCKGLPLLLGQVAPNFVRPVHLPESGPGMMALESKVIDSDECLAAELLDHVWSSGIHGRWVRAFGYAPSAKDVKELLDDVKAVLALSA